MDFKITWIETSREAYSAIYLKHSKDFQVFGTVSDPTGTAVIGKHDGLSFMLTEWGFNRADAPLIRSIMHGEDAKYYIACIEEK